MISKYQLFKLTPTKSLVAYTKKAKKKHSCVYHVTDNSTSQMLVKIYTEIRRTKRHKVGD